MARTPETPPPPSTAPRYAATGVDLDRDEVFLHSISRIARTTFRAEVLAGIGGFAGLFKPPDRYRDPVFAASADGVGTKLTLAAQLGRFDTVGIDCVAMVVNDLVALGAEPLIFLDYLAMGSFDSESAEAALRGLGEGCRRAGCALLGGETATMPGTYAAGELELVGFGVGVAERQRLIDGSTISEGDALIGIASSGVHSNGFALIRQVLDANSERDKIDLFAEDPILNQSPASALLAPTRIYVKSILNLSRAFEIRGLIHVTGGGLPGNMPRVLPRGVAARVDLDSWPRQPIFDWIAQRGGIDEEEMLRVFNCGLGMVAIVARDSADEVLERLLGLGERAYRIGVIERRGEGQKPLHLGRGSE